MLLKDLTKKETTHTLKLIQNLFQLLANVLLMRVGNSIAPNGSQISEGTNSVGIVRWDWAFAYVLLCSRFAWVGLTKLLT